MIPNHYIKKWLSISNWLAALEFQVKKHESPCHHLKINSEKSGKLTCPLKINGWNMHFILKWSLFRGRIRKFSGVSLRGICHICLPCWFDLPSLKLTAKAYLWKQAEPQKEIHLSTIDFQGELLVSPFCALFSLVVVSIKYFLFSPRKLGKMNPFWQNFFNWVGSTTNQLGIGGFLDDLLRSYGSHKLRQSPLNSLVIVRVFDPLALKTKDFHPWQVQKDWTCTKDCSWDSIYKGGFGQAAIKGGF